MMYNVLEYGACADGRFNNQAALQNVVDECSRNGGGTVYFPAGAYLSGTIALKSNIHLLLDAGAILMASSNPDHYGSGNKGHLLTAEACEHVSISGNGTILGTGKGDYGKCWGVNQVLAFRTGMLLFTNCTDIAIRGIRLLYSDAWTIHLFKCDTVFIEGITIRNNLRRINSDGIDPNSCRNVHISDCHIVAGDDCIVLKATENKPCENITVVNCTLVTGCAALKLGTESFGNFRNIHFSNCTIQTGYVGIGLYMKDGGCMEAVTFSNITIDTLEEEEAASVFPVFMDIEKRHEDSRIGRIRDITLDNIRIRSGSGLLVQGMPESPIENLTLRNILIRVDRSVDYTGRMKAVGSANRSCSDQRDTCYARASSYMTLAHVGGFSIENIRLAWEHRCAVVAGRSVISGFDLKHGRIAGVSSDILPDEVRTAAIQLHNSAGIEVEKCPGGMKREALL